ncbi:alpha/beta hydrolase [Streptomyces sp. NPDC003077]|uniref:alpha/beta hydrolase family protein n=1 Tax=Streptomyces sp. NPDC003077 TaxID=3154443 RepID=UPI0033B7B280
MRRRSFAGAAVAAAMAAALGAVPARAVSAAPPGPGTVLSLPRPAGKQTIGVTSIFLEDEGRADPWVAGENRRLMVSLWYPARKPSGTPAAYMTAAESRMYLAATKLNVPLDLLSGVRTHAGVDAAPAGPRGGLPLVVLSPGFGMPRATLSGIAEELASRGYAVAAIGHNHEANGISFPDGETTGCAVCGNPDHRTVGDTRAKDVSFVLNELTKEHPVWEGGRLVDTGRIAMVGHSAGGYSAIPAMVADPRIKAGVNMDGNFRYPNGIPVDRPFLMLGNPSHVPGGPDGTWDATWRQLTGWKRWLSVDGTDHLSFTDLAPLGKQHGRSFQELDGDRCDAITRAYLAAFLDTHLRGRHVPLLDGPSARYPEVRFHRP